MPRLGNTDFDVHPLCLGGNVFGWTADEPASFAVLDAYAAAGGNFIDTADSYAAWVDGNSGGESEAILGNWMAARGNRERVVIATKVGRKPDRKASHPRRFARLQTSPSRGSGPTTSISTTRTATTTRRCRSTKRSARSTSSYRLARSVRRRVELLSLTASRSSRYQRASGLASYVALQPHYNLVERDGYEGELSELCARRGLPCVPYFALAMGFLTGKYRPGGNGVDSPRAGGAAAHLDARGERVLAALDDVAARRDAPVAAVALAWLAAQPTVASPIASARTPEQLADLLPMAQLELSPEEVGELSTASEVS